MLGTVTITSQAFRDTWGSPAGQWNHSLCIQHASAEICVCERTVTSCNSGCIMWHDILSLPSSVDVFKHVVAASNCVIWLPTAFQFNSEYKFLSSCICYRKLFVNVSCVFSFLKAGTVRIQARLPPAPLSRAPVHSLLRAAAQENLPLTLLWLHLRCVSLPFRGFYSLPS